MATRGCYFWEGFQIRGWDFIASGAVCFVLEFYKEMSTSMLKGINIARVPSKPNFFYYSIVLKYIYFWHFSSWLSIIEGGWVAEGLTFTLINILIPLQSVCVYNYVVFYIISTSIFYQCAMHHREFGRLSGALSHYMFPECLFKSSSYTASSSYLCFCGISWRNQKPFTKIL